MLNDTLVLLAPFATQITHVGSRETCDPAPADTDSDILVLLDLPFLKEETNQRIRECMAALEAAGWVMGGSLPVNETGDTISPEKGFYSWTKGDENLILTGDYDFHNRFLVATSLAKKLNLLVKDDRIQLFQAVLYGNRHNLTAMPCLLLSKGIALAPQVTMPDDFDELFN